MSTRPPQPMAGGSARPRLLVVDDQPANVQAMYRLFADDYQVLGASGGEQALALCGSRQPDLVLLDVEMPGMDGLEVCARLKADPVTRDIPVIFVTAHENDEIETLGLVAGAVDFITKPVHPAIVRARVRTHLTLKAQADLLRQWAWRDGLTGVANRRHFDQQLSAAWACASRGGEPLSVLLLDVDHFKAYNDHHGHLAGDDCLRRVAEVLAATLARPGDLLARYGGEEFAALLPATDAADALACAERLLGAVKALALPHGASVTPELSVSIGCCTLPAGTAGSPGQLLAGADAQLYEAKKAGRRCARGAVLGA